VDIFAGRCYNPFAENRNISEGMSMLYRNKNIRRWMRSWHSAHMAVSIILLTLPAACTVGPDYVRPAAEVPASYKETEGWKVAQPNDHLIRGAWWETFNDLYLNGLEEQVAISNQSIATAEAQLRQARALVGIARAGYFPTVTIGGSYTRSFNVSGTGASAKGSTSTPGSSGAGGSSGRIVSDYVLPGAISWEPDLWGRIRRTVESNRANAQASAADLEATRLLVQAELAQNYLQLRTLDAQKHLLETTVIAFQKFLELTKNRYAQGVASKADVLQAETQLKTTQAQAIDIGVLRAQLEHAIAVLVGKPASLFSIPVAPIKLVPPDIPVGVPSELLERRPDIAGAERRMAAANAQIGVAVAAYYPAVTLSASGGYASSILSDLLNWPSRFWALGASISEVVFEGDLRRAQTEQAWAAYDATVASYRQTVLTGFQEVEDNLAALRILQDEAQVQGEAVKAAQQSLTVTINQYKAGVVGYLNVIVAQAAALNNEITSLNILGRRMVASVLLVKSLGGGWNTSTPSPVSDPPDTDKMQRQSMK
jgi:NodT family efflux transporter outer membrane factor (OMF) lipoprotein